MTIDDLIKRAKSNTNALIAQRNNLSEQINRARAAGDGALERQLLNERAPIDAQRIEAEANLRSLEAEKAEDERIYRLQSESVPTSGPSAFGAPGPTREADVASGISVSESGIYRKDNQAEVSYFRDLVNARKGDLGAAERLQRNEANWRSRNPQAARALDTSVTAGGSFAPPAWLVADFIEMSRASRVTADLLHGETLPEGVSSVNLPKVATGATAAVVQTQNTTITEVDVTTTSVSSGICTIAGGQTVSIQLLHQSGTPIDQVILADLAADYARAFNAQVISGSGINGQMRGILTVTAGTTVTYTSAAPKVVSTTAADSFYSMILDAKLGVETSRYASPDAIVMHPRRWNWVLKALDGDGRPLVVPTTSSDAPGVSGGPVASGLAGELAGIPVYVDPLIPTNLGAGTNQDTVILIKRDDLWLWESALRLETFEQTLARQGSVYFRAFGFAALIADRVPASIARISGTGLVTP